MENTAILLVNSKLREQYENLNSETEKAKKELLKALKAQSGIKPSELEGVLSVSFTGDPADFYLVLGRLHRHAIRRCAL
jgi:hypothetical protein